VTPHSPGNLIPYCLKIKFTAISLVCCCLSLVVRRCPCVTQTFAATCASTRWRQWTWCCSWHFEFSNFKLIKLFNEILYCFLIWSFVEVLCVKNGRRLSFEFDDPSSLAESKRQAAFPGIDTIRNYSGVLSES